MEIVNWYTWSQDSSDKSIHTLVKFDSIDIDLMKSELKDFVLADEKKYLEEGFDKQDKDKYYFRLSSKLEDKQEHNKQLIDLFTKYLDTNVDTEIY